MFGFGKKVTPTAMQSEKKAALELMIKFVEESCRDNLGEIAKFKHPDWAKAENTGDFRTLVTMYAAAATAYEKHADHMFSEWMKLAKSLGINVDGTTEFWYLVNRRFAHLAQVRCFLDYQLKMTLVSSEERTANLPTIGKILTPEMSDEFLYPSGGST
jgi:hypothetical protein